MDNKQNDINELNSLIDEIQAICDEIVTLFSGIGEKNCYDSLMLLKNKYIKVREKLEKEM